MRDVVTVVEDFLAAVTTGEIAAATEMLASDVVVYHSTRLPYHGVYIGRTGFGEIMSKIGTYWERFEPTPSQQVIRDEDGAVVIGALRGKPRHHDEEIAIRVLERYEVKDGQISAIWPFYIDTHLTEEQVSP